MSKENPLWGAPRIRDELALLGHAVCKDTIAKYMVRSKDPARSQSWRTFLANHMAVGAACDFFTVPTLTFKLLYVFVVLSHDRRRIVRVDVTRHPTAEWTANQITEALPGDHDVPRYLHRDRDSIYGDVFQRRVTAMHIEQVVNAKQSPWQNPFVERVIGSVRRECTDYIIALGERHLRSVLREYVRYYNTARCHQSLEGNAPEPRHVESGPGARDPVSRRVASSLLARRLNKRVLPCALCGGYLPARRAMHVVASIDGKRPTNPIWRVF